MLPGDWDERQEGVRIQLSDTFWVRYGLGVIRTFDADTAAVCEAGLILRHIWL